MTFRPGGPVFVDTDYRSQLFKTPFLVDTCLLDVSSDP